MRNIFDNKGFLDLNSDNFTPIKVIEGGDITMEGVSRDIFAYPVRGGAVQRPTLMRPNENHRFNADYVVEVPKFMNGTQFGTPPLAQTSTDPVAQFRAFSDGLFNQQRLRTINNIQPPYLQGNEYDIDGDGVPNSIDRRDELAGIYGTTEPENIFGSYTSAPFVGANEFRRTKFSDFVQDPASLVDIDLNTSLFKAGQSFGFDPEILENADAQNQARRGNLLRGVGAVGKSLLNIGRLVGGGLGFQNRQNAAIEQYLQQRREALAQTGNFRFAKNGGLLQFFRGGGTVDDLPMEKALTGEYITGLPENREQNANAEVEKGEYIQHPNTDVQKVVGKTHESGGEKVNLESGTRVISDNLKIGGDLSKMLRKEYDIKTKAKDTYARTIDKYTKKIGLSALNDEQEALFKKLEQEEDTKDEATANLNRQFLSERIREIEKEKSPLLAQRKDFVEFIFDKQESNKTAEEKLPEFKDGGTFSSSKFRKLCKKHGISEKEGMKLMKSFKYGGTKKKKRKYQLGGFTFQQNSFNTDDLSPRQQQSFTNFGFPRTSGNVNSPEALNERVLELIRLNPVLAAEIFGSPDSGLNIDEQSIRSFQEGFNTNAQAIVDFIANSDAFTDEEKTNIASSVGNEIFKEDGAKEARAFDGILGNFTSSRPGFQFNAVTPEDRQKLNKSGVTSYKQLLTPDGKINPDLGLSNTSLEGLKRFENFSGDFLIGEIEESAPVVQAAAPIATPAEPAKKATPENPDPNAGINNLANPSRPRQSQGIPFLPDQSKAPPTGLIPHLKIERQFERLDPVAITNEDNLKSIFRQQDFAAEQLEGLPDSQRRSVLASMVANSQEVANQSVTQTNIANAQNFQQTEQFNINQSNNEENARASDLLNFETRQLTALAKTQADLDNFLDFNQRGRFGNFQTASTANLLNGIYENFNVSPFGSVQFDPSQYAALVINALNNADKTTQVAAGNTAQANTTQSTTNTNT